MAVKSKIEVTVGNATREVFVNIVNSNYSTGFVGKAFFAWRSDKYDLPYVSINRKVADRRTKYLVRLFLMKYKEMLMNNKKSPMHFEESESSTGSSSSSSKKSAISGVPYWMREEHKEWIVCHRKDGSTYMRRTRFKPESKDIIEKYLPHCSHCPFRVNCEKACIDPELMSDSDIFVTNEEAEEMKKAN